MKPLVLLLLAICGITIASAQNIQVDATTYTPQQLVEDILIDSGCIENIQITNATTGNFADGDNSYGYFSANGSNFPFQKGLVLSTGKLQHSPGPNNTLSDDDAPHWFGDPDLEAALNISNTTNATILEFDFLPNADNIQFRYIFASEEYQEGDPNTCIYSDAFAFLIKPIGGNYTNIAVVPGTNTPVLVTTVHSGIPGACPPINSSYFAGWNGVNVPINFNGQTQILTAQTPVVPNQPYHIKLVIADEANYRYDSAVFLEGGSFNIAANLGPDRSFVNRNPLCANETYILDATPQGNTPLSYKWFKDGIIIPGETSAQLTVTQAGTYKVEIDFGNGCNATAQVLIEYAPPMEVSDTELFQCEANEDGIATFNLFDAEAAIINGDESLHTVSFHHTYQDAADNTLPITNPMTYTNTQPDEIVFARIVSDLGCEGVAQITLKTTTEMPEPFFLVSCSNPGTPFFADFNLSTITNQLLTIYGNDIAVKYYGSYNEAISHTNPLPNPFTNTVSSGVQLIYARITGSLGCVAIAKVNLRVTPTPEFEGPDTFIYCVNTAPETLTLHSGLIGTQSDVSINWSTGETTNSIEVDTPGTYTVRVTRTRTINGERFSCEGSRTITVIGSSPAVLDYQLTGNFGSQTVTITASGTGIYTYSLDNENGQYTETNVFDNIKPGVHTVYATDENGCGESSIKIYVLGFPNYFTPNNDGYHDQWSINGLNFEELQLQQVYIYDRFGKPLYSLKLNGSGWDGDYNGKPLPTSDYWFKAIFMDGSTYKGHFSLVR